MNNYIVIILVLALITLYITINLQQSSLSIDGIDEKVADKNIYFGQTIDLQYNISAYRYYFGFRMAFQSVNRKGGIKGHKLNIVLLDDRYEVDLALKNANLLANYYNVLAIIGSYGARIANVITDEIADKQNVPFIAPYACPQIVRKRFYKNLILTSGPSTNEFKLIFDNLKQNNITNIGVIYLNTELGLDALNTFTDMIVSDKIPINIINIASFEKNQLLIYDTYKKLFGFDRPYQESYSKEKINQIQAVVLFISGSQLPGILGTLKKINPDLYIYYNYFVGTDKKNYQIVKDNTKNIYQTLLSYDLKKKFPILYNKLSDEINYYNNLDIKSKDAVYSTSSAVEMEYGMFTGFYTGLLIIKVLESLPDLDKITRTDFINKFYEIKNFDIGGLKIGPFELGKSNLGINYASLNKIVDQDLILLSEINSNNNHVNDEMMYNKMINSEMVNSEAINSKIVYNQIVNNEKY